MDDFIKEFSKGQQEVRVTDQGYLAGPRQVTKPRKLKRSVYVITAIITVLVLVVAYFVGK